jgi:hypothetical protein
VAPLLPKLRGQVAEFLNQCSLDRLGMLYLPTCVGLGYGLPGRSLEAFLGSRGSPTSPHSARTRASGSNSHVQPTGFAWRAPYTLTPRQPTRGLGYLPASPRCSPAPHVGRSVSHPRKDTTPRLASVWPAWTRPKRYRNINRSSIDYASRPRLRSRLTLGGLTFPRNPWAYGGRVFHPSFATHAGIRTRQASTARFPGRFTRLPTLPYPPAPLAAWQLPTRPKVPVTRTDVRMPQLRWCA